YIVKYKLEDWIFEPGKEIILSELADNWDDNTAFIKESVAKDSLKSLMKYYFENIKTMEEVVNLDQDIFLNEFKDVIEDSLITEEEISSLTQLMKKEEYEKSKSN
ncbi:MAG TPA: hypothetical protein VIY47_01705, partial [Ignavibacteriaceae bacterium]